MRLLNEDSEPKAQIWRGLTDNVHLCLLASLRSPFLLYNQLFTFDLAVRRALPTLWAVLRIPWVMVGRVLMSDTRLVSGDGAARTVDHC